MAESVTVSPEQTVALLTVGAAGAGVKVIVTAELAAPHGPDGLTEVSVSVTLVSPAAGVYTVLREFGLVKDPFPPDQVPVVAPPEI